ncbi:S-adenosylmethionine mitochondrial carrier protein-like isoform X1 [Acanthaster planci]|uniref:S-adenosylmethionine mitochondrial carrier protein-like isoform X1 n=1 Tax=Acanthaster planci TaxID=133434 RepID=A0A8B7XZR4_ACAPL|nr:S-adenosylmethionine mitochondrial carrier protein-like isoform X1 [Acanthaster planci]
MSEQTPPLLVALVSGGLAGTAVDASLFPLDTIKTRLQSSDGFLKAGGFRGIYAGLGPAVLGSAPTAGVFFCTYELTKHISSSLGSAGNYYEPITHMMAASLGEVVACLIRVPVEVVKQRAQASRHASTSILRSVLREEGVRGLYRGYLSTVMREIPFSIIQFPLWEILKVRWGQWQGRPVDAWQSSICGAVAGGISAGVTTPLDVAKTRIILAAKDSKEAKGNIPGVLKDIMRTRGVRGLFAGVVPRVLWISIGGAIFLGVYEKAKISLLKLNSPDISS